MIRNLGFSVITAAVFGNVILYSLVKQTNAFEEHISFFRAEDSLLAVCSLFNDAVSNSYYTGCLQMNGAVSKVNKKFISHLTRAKPTPLAAATVPVSYVLITILQCVHSGSHDTHPHGNQIHPTLGVACPL